MTGKVNSSGRISRDWKREPHAVRRSQSPTTEAVAKLVGYGDAPRPRVAGSIRVQTWISADFEEPLPDDILAAFYGEENE
jgi:hypothetical protein